MTTLVYDIETIPDLDGARLILNLPEASDSEIYAAMSAKRLEKNQNPDFWSHHLQKIVAISVVVAQDDHQGNQSNQSNQISPIKVWSLGELNSPEAEIIERFFKGIEKYKPTLVSWNGSGFDLPVLHYRSLIHKIQAPQYWELGQNQPDFRWNNYLSRYHLRHMDLMDILSAYQGRAVAPLDEIAKLLGCPGKQILSGHGVWEAYKAGELENIRHYCEIDVLNTYLVFLRFEYLRGVLSAETYQQRYLALKNYLNNNEKQHLVDFGHDLPENY
ncbi:MAG: 3'-5' exonuclease [Gammaproteobacteria bacterium]